MMAGILQLLLWEVFIPAAVGSIFLEIWRPVVRSTFGRICACLMSGQLLLWGVFELISVPLILRQQHLSDVIAIMRILTGALLLASLVLAVILRKKRTAEQREKLSLKRPETVLWCVFGGLLLLQLVMAVTWTYRDGDDSFYVPIATVSVTSNALYASNPYTGLATGMNFRYGLAPFPIWIAMLSSLSGVATSVVAHISFQLEMILLAYIAYALLGKLLLKEKKELLPLFLILMEVLILFGDVSSMTPENFLLARSRQGKAALATLVIPVLIILLYLLMERLQGRGRFGLPEEILLISATLSGCLCSTLSALLCCMLLGCAGICSAVMFRKWKHLLLLALPCVPCFAYALIYLMMH